MTVEDKLRELLHEAAPFNDGVAFAEVADGVRRRRRRAATFSSAATALAVVAVVLAVTLVPGRSAPGVGATTPPPTPTPLNSTLLLRPQPGKAPSAVRFNGIVYRFPDSSWHLAEPTCGTPANHTVTIGVWQGSCPGRAQPVRSPIAVRLTPLYGPQFALNWPGKRTVWNNWGPDLVAHWPGEPAWLGTQHADGTSTATLALPWLNAYVEAQAPTMQQARALLNRVEIAGSRWLIPADASSIFVQSLAGHDGDHQQRNATVQRPRDIKALLDDLRALTTTVDPTRACDGQWWPTTALLTVRTSSGSQQTFAARFGTCRTVTAGTGAAAATSQQLLDDIKRLVPNSGL